jgi:hypothetical protein
MNARFGFAWAVAVVMQQRYHEREVFPVFTQVIAVKMTASL